MSVLIFSGSRNFFSCPFSLVVFVFYIIFFSLRSLNSLPGSTDGFQGDDIDTVPVTISIKLDNSDLRVSSLTHS